MSNEEMIEAIRTTPLDNDKSYEQELIEEQVKRKKEQDRLNEIVADRWKDAS